MIFKRHGLGIDSQMVIDRGCNILRVGWAIYDMFAS